MKPCRLKVFLRVGWDVEVVDELEPVELGVVELDTGEVDDDVGDAVVVELVVLELVADPLVEVVVGCPPRPGLSLFPLLSLFSLSSLPPGRAAAIYTED